MVKEKTFRVATLGCRTNQYETQAYRDQLLALGWEEAKEGEEAALCIVNTCTVTEGADSSSRHQIRQFSRQNPEAKVVVTGCLSERVPHLKAEIPQISQIVPNLHKEQLIQELFPHEENIPEFAIRHFEAHTRAFVKVQDGCNSFCTYCIIPYVRGRSRSRKIEDVVREVEGLIAEGYQEVVLTGINIGDFDGGGEGKRLVDLVRAVDQVPGLKRLRLSSIDPDEVDLELQETILSGKTTCHSLHLVLQSGSNVVLKRMNRKYTRHIFMETVERLLKADPDFTFTTDVIVGFPGETEADFEETLEVMKEVKFAKVHLFPYSKRERTRAALYPNHLPSEVIHQRKEKMLREAEESAFQLRERFVGRITTVLTESSEEGETTGHTENFLRVRIPNKQIKANQLVEVKFIANSPDGLLGE